MTPKPLRHTQEFEWGTSPTGILQLRHPPAGQWLNVGAPVDVLPRWCTQQRVGALGNPDKEVVARSVDTHEPWFTPSRLTTVCDLLHERLFPETWRVTAPNAVWHHAFGPGVTVATDGVHVILFDSPTAPTVWLEVHRNNVIGPVTSVPLLVEEWDYVQNKAGGTRSGGSGPAKKSLRQQILDTI